ncbi:NAD-dependent epimerase/dehydratase family protein [Taibaiella koreensis]|uniref:NAD-dependent epimerase/dehydratase family protein n=1 Tax=Taibaiella koreensis TaxID=1268548 RepID=UPI000E59C23C|nr:NAD-dependent epimerase/dehydratase family protein [Taibaiella koreensis]
MSRKRVLLTGVTGFLGSHTAIQLLNKGYEVIGTLRSSDRIKAIREVIAKHTANSHNLIFAEADLSDAAIWRELTKDIDYVQHIASPFPRTLPRHEDDLIVPARQGTLNVLKAAAANKVKRVVMVSSVAAVAYGKPKNERNKMFDEKDWTDEKNKKDTTPYLRSKAIAEKAAWAFMRQNNTQLELTTVLPGAILGTVLEEDFGTSANIVIKILDGSSPALPKIGFDIVDVRSVSDLLIRAMEIPQAAGNRYIASSGYLTFKEIALLLKQHYPNRKIPTVQLPNFAVRLFANFDHALKPVLIELDTKRKTDSSEAQRQLQWQPLSAQEAVLACAKSIFENGIIT